MKITTIRVKNLLLRAIIGINKEERYKKQDILINLKILVKNSSLFREDALEPDFNYKVLTKQIISSVENSEFFLLERLTSFILNQIMENDHVVEASVEVDKPHALRFSESVSVQMSDKKMNEVIIGLGSNIEPTKSIAKSKALLQKFCHIQKESSLIQTKPIGFSKQADFINGAVLVKTELEQYELTAELKRIEKNLGRKKTANKNGPRTIDLDILLWNKKVVDLDVYNRDFLKTVIKEIDPFVQI